MRPRIPFDRSRLSAIYPVAEVDYVAALVKAQGAQDDEPFARSIGISPSLWRKTRDGRKPLGWKLALRGADLVPYSITEAAHQSLKHRAKERAA